MAKKATTNRRSAAASQQAANRILDKAIDTIHKDEEDAADKKCAEDSILNLKQCEYQRGFADAINTNPLTYASEQIRQFRERHAQLTRDIELTESRIKADKIEIQHLNARIEEFTLKLNHAVDQATKV